MRANSQPSRNGFANCESAPAANTLAFRIRGNGAPVVFLHGVGLNKDAWRKQEEFFSPSRTTIVCDLPGHGQSPTPTHSHPLPPTHSPTHSPAHPPSRGAEEAGLSDYSAPVAALLDELGFVSADIVGHSFGGLVALDFALRFPQKTRRVVVLNGVFCRPPAARKAALQRATALANGDADPAAESALRRWFGDSWDSETSALAVEVRQWLRDANPSGYARAYCIFAECDAAFARHLSRLSVPALFVTGEDDPHSTAEMSREMARIAPQGQCEILPGQRHMAALAAPDIVNPILMRFLLPSTPPTHPTHSTSPIPSTSSAHSAPSVGEKS